MNSKVSFYNFVLKMVQVDWKDFVIFTSLYTLIVFILSSFLLMRGAIIEDIHRLDVASADLVIQRIISGKSSSVPKSWIEKIENIEGVTSIYERRFIRYFFEPVHRYFTLVGYSTFQNHSNRDLNSYLENIDMTLDTDKGVIIGKGVESVLKRYHFRKKIPLNFASGKKVELPIIGVFNQGSSLTSNDIILVPNNVIENIIGLAPDEVTDLTVRISNQELKEMIAKKIVAMFANSRVLDLHEVMNMTSRFYNQFSGIFLSLLALPVMTFLFLLFARAYALKKSTQRQIAILRVIGWPMSLILQWHLWSSLLIATTSFMLGVLLSYIYIVFFNGFGLSALFLGHGNLPIHYQFPIHYSLSTLFYIALFSIPPFILSSLYPAYRLGRKDPREVLR